MNNHDSAVAAIATRVRKFYDRQQAFRIYHGSTNSTRESKYRRDNIIDTSTLTRVLHIDKDKKTALVEPNVPMDALVAATLPSSLIPPVVMEFPGITVGGGFSGTSGESSSFRYGFFDRTVNWVEMVLANGEKVTASGSEKLDLFYGAAASFGTLGVVTLLEIQLIEAKPYVELTYRPYRNITEALPQLEKATADATNDYLDGIVLAKDQIVICSGRLTDSVGAGVKIQQFTRPSDPWFYLHAQKVTSKTDDPVVEAVPLPDYLFRYDRGGFWVGRYAFKYFITPFNSITRRLLDRFMHTRVMYRALHQSGHSKRNIIQDVAIPYSAAEDFANWLDVNFGHYPLWLCPLKQHGKAPDSPHGLLAEHKAPNAPEYLINFGVWGPGPTNRRDFVSANRRLEQKVEALHGKKWLYAHTYYTEDEFWSIYDRKNYDALRAKYHAQHLPNIYDKVKVDITAEEKALQESWILWFLAFVWSLWPISGLYALYKAYVGGEYLLPNQMIWRTQAKKNV